MKILLVFISIASLLYPLEVHAEGRGNIIDFFNSKDVIKTYVPDVVNSSGDGRIDIKKLKHDIEKALTSRLSHTFEIVERKTDADIIINIEVMEYLWMENDPLDMVMGIPAMIYDAASKKNYARMKVIFVIVDAKNNTPIWWENLQSTITRATMTEEESYGLSNERITEVFMRELFKKPKSR